MQPAIARRTALSVLDALDGSDATPDQLLSKAFEENPPPKRRDRALANELVFGVLRWRGRLDWIIEHLSKRPVHRIDPLILNTIRLGVYQILFLSRVPVSAAVNDCVELAKGKSTAGVVRFVNAVLRSAARKAKDLSLPNDTEDPVSAVAVRESHPVWMVRRWVRRLGVEQTIRLCKANNQIPPVTIRANTLKADRETLASSMAGHARNIALTRFVPDGLMLRGLETGINDMPAFNDGWFQVQDEAAQIVTYLLDPKPGEAVLDACAGLGGKTGHIAQLMGDRGKIVAADSQSWKLSKLEATMRRLGVCSVSTWHRDLTTGVAEDPSGAFDRVLLDAPCSGLGVIRRNPDIKWKKRKKDLARLQAKQQRLLACVAPLVKAGGVLVYCVCSLEPEEGQEVVEDFLISKTDFAIDRAPTGFCEIDELLTERSGFLRTLPHEHETDGFFAVRLKKIAA